MIEHCFDNCILLAGVSLSDLELVLLVTLIFARDRCVLSQSSRKRIETDSSRKSVGKTVLALYRGNSKDL